MKKLFTIPCFIILVLGFAGCNVGGNDTPSAPSSAILFGTLSPDAPAVNITYGDISIAGGMPYSKYTPYAQVPAGTSKLQVTDATGSTTFADVSVSPEEGKYYSAFLIDSAKKMKVAFLKDELTSVSADSVKIRFLNFSPNSSAIDLAVKDGDILFANRNFNDQDLSPDNKKFIELKAGNYNLIIKEAGTSSIIAGPTLYTLEGGGTYTIFLKGFVSGTSEKALSLGNIRHS
ncbi:MAG: DUF4397 domain-containing protein [Ilyomonas sp.]